MTYIYHRVPKNMRGNILYPLNVLKEIHPDIYKKEVSKYDGREFIKKQEIPFLNCIWNDVLHFTAVHPQDIKQAFLDLGVKYNLTYYQIDPNSLPEKDTIVYLYRHEKPEDKLKDDNFSPYRPSEVSLYSNLLDVTKAYYKEQLMANNKPLLYHRVPHILYKGNLDITGIPIGDV